MTLFCKAVEWSKLKYFYLKVFYKVYPTFRFNIGHLENYFLIFLILISISGFSRVKQYIHPYCP